MAVWCVWVLYVVPDPKWLRVVSGVVCFAFWFRRKRTQNDNIWVQRRERIMESRCWWNRLNPGWPNHVSENKTRLGEHSENVATNQAQNEHTKVKMIGATTVVLKKHAGWPGRQCAVNRLIPQHIATPSTAKPSPDMEWLSHGMLLVTTDIRDFGADGGVVVCFCSIVRCCFILCLACCVLWTCRW